MSVHLSVHMPALHACTHVGTHVCAHICTHGCTHICTYVCSHGYTHVCQHLFVVPSASRAAQPAVGDITVPPLVQLQPIGRRAASAPPRLDVHGAGLPLALAHHVGHVLTLFLYTLLLLFVIIIIIIYYYYYIDVHGAGLALALAHHVGHVPTFLYLFQCLTYFGTSLKEKMFGTGCQ